MISPVPDDEAQIPDFNYKIRPMDVYVPQQFNKVERTIEDVKINKWFEIRSQQLIHHI